MEYILNNVWQYVDIVYILVCNVITYLIISSAKDKEKLTTTWKRLISTVVAIIMGMIMIRIFQHDQESIFVSFFLQFLMYDYILKWLFKKLEMEKFTQPDNPDSDPDSDNQDSNKNTN